MRERAVSRAHDWRMLMEALPGFSRDHWRHRYYGRYSFSRIAESRDRMRVALILPALGISGGVNVALRHVRSLAALGHAVTVVAPDAEETASVMTRDLRESGVALVSSVNETEEFDIVIATWWETLFRLKEFRFRHAVYFVQSIESRFYESDLNPRAEAVVAQTYNLHLPIVTVSLWLQTYLGLAHGTPSLLVPNGIEKSIFDTEGDVLESRVRGKLRVLIEGNPDAPMKGVAEALRAAQQSSADEIWLLSPVAVEDSHGAIRVIAEVPPEVVAQVYRSCDVLVKLSRVEGMYGPPLEMFHCGGTLVTWPTTGSEEFVEDDWNAMVVPMEDVESATDALNALKGDSDRLDRLKRGAVETARTWPSWRESSRRFCGIMTVISGLPAVDPGPLLESIEEIREQWNR